MASHIVPPKDGIVAIVKCKNCATLYVPDPKIHPFNDPDYFERCPMCRYAYDSRLSTIPLWKYNLIKFFRGRWNDPEGEENVE